MAILRFSRAGPMKGRCQREIHLLFEICFLLRVNRQDEGKSPIEISVEKFSLGTGGSWVKIAETMYIPINRDIVQLEGHLGLFFVVRCDYVNRVADLILRNGLGKEAKNIPFTSLSAYRMGTRKTSGKITLCANE